MRSHESDRRDGGGWVPVIRNHRTHSNGKLKGKKIVTLFVDNIPEDRDLQWLTRTFNKFGVVWNAFIPRKRSIWNGSKFGFVRFDCHVSAGMAVSKLNGVWVDNQRLFVKEACFGIDKGKASIKVPRFHEARVHGQAQKAIPSFNFFNQEGKRSVWHGKQPEKSFVEAMRGETSKPPPLPSQNIIIRAENIGSGWLHRCAVGVMNRVVSLITLKVSFSMETNLVAQF